MEVKSVNAFSFNGWTNGSKNLVKKAVSLLGEEGILADRLVQKMEEHSPHHFLYYKEGALLAAANTIGADTLKISAEDVAGKGLLNSLKKMDKFLAHQNTVMPKRYQRVWFMWKNLMNISDRSMMENGVSVGYHTLPVYLSCFATEVEKSKKSFDFQNVVRQIKRIDEKAIECGLQVRILPYKDGGAVIYKGKEPLYKANKHASLERLNDTEAYLDMYAKEIQSAFPDWSKIEQYRIQAQPVKKEQGFLSKIYNAVFKRA